MSRYLYHGGIYPALLIRMLISLAFFSLSRSLYYFFNVDLFSDMDSRALLIAFIGGIRFDITAAIVLNAPYLLMNTIPAPIRTNNIWQQIANIVFYTVNIFGFALNGIDSVYFRFTSKRMTADIFSFIKTGDEDLISLLPAFIGDFYPEILAWLLLSVFFIWASSRITVKHQKNTPPARFYLINTLYFILVATLAIIGIRGGFQLRPITIIDAGRYAQAKNVSLVLNTPFSIIKSYGHTGLKEVVYFHDQKQLEAIFSPVYDALPYNTPMKRYNVVVFIMESFGIEYIASLNGISGAPAYTPHLDSIVADGFAFRAFANGKQSMEALPAIVAGLPSLTTRPYITSAYGSNQINSLASLLYQEGYTSAFFHGGRNGTMGFESFVGIAGFDQYFGKDEYGNDEHFDGNWGIYDEEFFGFFRKHLDRIPEPFFMSFFSLSSHHPYSVPAKYSGKFNKGTLDIHESIMYADFSLGKFFREAEKSAWYRNTLFVITADHTSLSYEKQYQSREGIYAIPVIFYMPGVITPEINKDIAQQTDIMPSVLGFLGYQHPYVAFGNNLFDSAGLRYAVNHLDGTYQLIREGWTLQFDGTKTVMLEPMEWYDGSIAGHDPSTVKDALESFLKAYIQQYNYRLLNNELVIRHNDE